MRALPWSFVLTLVLLAAGLAGAQDDDIEAPPTSLPANSTLSPEWSYSIRPYFFLSGLSGSVTVESVTFPVNSSFGDLLKNVELGAFINFSAEKGRWGVSADFQYINLYGESSGALDNSLDLKNTIGEVDLVFRPAGAPTLRFLAGVRVYSISQTVTLLGHEIPEASSTVVDPVLGAHGSWMLSDRWGFELRGDIGGFGVSSEFTYQMMALFKWGISDTVSLPFGYRVLGYQIRQDDVRMNTRMGGLVLGVDVRF